MSSKLFLPNFSPSVIIQQQQPLSYTNNLLGFQI